MICWLNRLFRGHRLDDGRPLSPALQRHLATCATCREAWAVEQQVALDLARGAAAVRREPSPFLHGRVMETVRREATDRPAPSRVSVPRLAWLTAGAAAAVATAVLLRTTLEPSAPAPMPAVAWQAALPNATKLARWGTMLDQPLRREGELVLQDARNVMTGLASNLLPGDLQASHLLP